MDPFEIFLKSALVFGCIKIRNIVRNARAAKIDLVKVETHVPNVARALSQYGPMISKEFIEKNIADNFL